MGLDALSYNDQGLVPVIAQDAETGEVRMMAYADRTAIERTLKTNEAHFFSRSRQKLWKKGESSGNTMSVREVWVDCDGDTLIYLVDPAGPSCHTGEDTCFFRQLDAAGELVDPTGSAAPTLLRLERILGERRASTADKSYTKSLLDGGPTKVDAKIREEAEELGQALISESDDRVASEAGDVLYHLMVGLVLWKSRSATSSKSSRNASRAPATKKKPPAKPSRRPWLPHVFVVVVVLVLVLDPAPVSIGTFS